MPWEPADVSLNHQLPRAGRLSTRARLAARGQRGEPAPFPSLSDKKHHSEWGVTMRPLLVTSPGSSITRPRAGEGPGSAGHAPSGGRGAVSALTWGCPFLTGQGGAQLVGSQPGQRLGGGRPTKVMKRRGRRCGPNVPVGWAPPSEPMANPPCSGI